MSAEYNKAAKTFIITLENQIVGMMGILNVPNGNIKNMFRVHRIVILPDYQGLGIGTKVLDFFGELYLSKGYRFCIRTTHLKMLQHCCESKQWIPTTNNNKNNITRTKHNMKYANLMSNQKMLERTCGSYEYIGENYLKSKKIIKIDEYDKKDIDIIKEKLTKLNDEFYIIVTHGTTKSNDDIDKICQSLGIVVDPLYIKSKDQLQMKTKYKSLKNLEI